MLGSQERWVVGGGVFQSGREGETNILLDAHGSMYSWSSYNTTITHIHIDSFRNIQETYKKHTWTKSWGGDLGDQPQQWGREEL